MNLNKTLHLLLQKQSDLKNKNIAVGYSAGADSTALLHLMAQKAKFFDFQLTAVFFSHSNSPMNHGEDISYEKAQEFCKQLNVPLIHSDIHMQKESQKSWEEIGRSNRLDFYNQSNFDFVFLGHHEDDQNETTMIQLFRGGGKGIAGMKEQEDIYFRPFLNIRKDVIYKYLNDNQLNWVEDPTNENTDFTRNFWRKSALPNIEKHYPEYSKSLKLFRKKQTQQNNLVFDLAVIDGLNELCSEKTINISNLSLDRKINLISHACSHFQSYLETAKIENFLEQANTKKEISINTNVYNLTIQKNKKESFLTLSLIPQLNNTSKLKLK